ncbi:MAG: hypothetical protein ACFFEN_05650 [Candidatus Thorarchaeota archaeon]
MPSYKQLLDISNATLVAMGKSMINMGLNIPLVWNECANVFENSAKNMLKDAGMVIDGNDVKTISESFVNKVKELGFCQRADILELTNDKVIVDLGECIFASATKVFRGTDRNFIPPCPFMSMLYSTITEKTGKIGYIESCQWKPEENTSIFTVRLE